MSQTPPDRRETCPEEFRDDLLLALASMAERSNRGQADVEAAMNGASLTRVPPGRVVQVLEELERSGFIEDLLRLSDGGTLTRVTPAGKTRARTLLARRGAPVPSHPGAR